MSGIELARERDLGAVRRLWARCFPGDEAFTDWYFTHIYRAEHTLLLRQGGQLAAMTQRLPYRMQYRGESLPVTYIYGACTAPEYRRLGLMRTLLEHSFRLDVEQGRVASTLIPQQPWLFDFYAQFGYRPAFYVQEGTLERGREPGRDAAGCTLKKLGQEDFAALLELTQRERAAMPCSFVMDEERLAQQCRMFDQLGAGVFGLWREGRLTAAAFVWDLPNALWAQELIGADGQVLCRLLLERSGKSRMRWTGPPGRDQRQALGCLRFHRPQKGLEEGYCNLLFN